MKVHNPSKLPTIDYRKVKPLQGNLKDLTEENYAKLKNVLEKDGFIVPLFLWKRGDNYYLIDGHQRHRVLTSEDYQPHEVPYVEIEAKDEADAKKKLLRISSQYGTITQEGYDEFSADLPEAELVETVNFDALKWSNEPEVEEDEPPPVDDANPAVSQLGEIYQLGKHRVACMDATESGSIKELMGGTLADMVFTDPPYGVDYEGKTKDKLKIENDQDTEVFAKTVERLMLKPGAPVYCCSPAGSSFRDFENAFADRFYYSQTIIWVKDSMVLGHGDYHYQHEPIIYGWEKELAHKFYGDRSQTTVWEIDRPKSSKEHPTMKPIKLLAKAISNSSKEGDVVLDPFLGSGTTIIAAEETGRICYGVEIDPKYCDVIRKRYWKLVNNDNEGGWEDNTKAITGEKQVNDAVPK